MFFELPVLIPLVAIVFDSLSVSRRLPELYFVFFAFDLGVPSSNLESINI